MKRLLVTGVPGWLTNALLESLAIAPPSGLEEVRCLMANPGPIPDISPSTVRFVPVVGRLEQDADMAMATRDCDAILHAAGLLHARRTSDWYEVNTEGTRRLVTAALKAGTRRIVFISSNAAAGRSTSRHRLMTERDSPEPLSHYGKSKLLAEHIVINSPLEGVVLRPCMFYGPPVPARHVDIYRRIQSGRMPVVGQGDFARSVTHIENLVQGCRLALTKSEAAGQTYYIADNQVYTTRRIVEAMARALGVTPRYIRLPTFTARLAYLGDRLLATLGIYWQNLHLVGEADWDVGVSIEKARLELGYVPTRTLDEGMQAAIDWCRGQGLLS